MGELEEGGHREKYEQPVQPVFGGEEFFHEEEGGAAKVCQFAANSIVGLSDGAHNSIFKNVPLLCVPVKISMATGGERRIPLKRRT